MDIRNKKMVFWGDSITVPGYAGTDETTIYWKRFEINDGCKTFGNAIGGSKISPLPFDPTRPYFLARVPELEEDADVVVVFGGTNDYSHSSTPIGKMSDRTDDTFYGALHNLMLALINKYPKATIVFMTPLHRLNEHNEYNEQGIRNVGCLEDYVNVIKEVAAYYAIPVLDLYRTSGLQPDVPKLRELYMPDGLHPNPAGHEIIYNRLKGFLQTL